MLAVGVVAFPPTACTVRDDEFLCEDAVAKLEGCCPSATVDPGMCTFQEGTCSSPAVYPKIGETQARCIIGSSCSEVRRGACGGGCP